MKKAVLSIFILVFSHNIYANAQEKILIKNVNFINSDYNQKIIYEILDQSNQTYYFDQNEFLEIIKSKRFQIETPSMEAKRSMSGNTGDGSGGG